MLSYLKKFCASAPAPFTAPPGVPTRAWARLDSGVGAFGWKRAQAFGCRRAGWPSRWPLWAVVCGLCCVAAGCRLWPCCCDRLALAPWAVACACWLVACGGLYSWPVGWRLCPCSVPVLVEAVSLRPVGGLWGAYISSSQETIPRSPAPAAPQRRRAGQQTTPGHTRCPR